MRNNEPLHPLQQCLRDNGEKIAAAVTESQFREVLAVNTELRAEVEQLKAQRDDLGKAFKDLRWRVDDTAEQLQATDYAGNRRYGLDEWSGPILNLKRAIDVIDAALSRIEVKP